MLIKTCFLFVFSILASANAWGQITNVTVNPNQFSRETGFQDTVNFSVITLYGAIAGVETTGACETTRTTSSVCDNCVPGQLPCSARRVHPTLRLEISFITTKRGRVRLYGGPSARSNDLGDYIQITNFESAGRDVPIGVEGQPNTVTFNVPWSELCATIGGREAVADPTCRGGNKVGELYFGMDAENLGVGSGDLELATSGGDEVNQERRLLIDIRGSGDNLGGDLPNFCTSDNSGGFGACNFDIFPGDGKAFVDAVRTFEPGFTTTNYSAVRVYYAKTPDVNSTSPFKDLNLPINIGVTGNTVPLEDNEITGLVNGQPYFFRIASVDIASNVGNITPQFVGDGLGDEICFDPTNPDKECHRTTPDDVIGLLEKEFDCFIATASYGSPTEHHVATFRSFRNKILHATSLGRALIRGYYRYSPPLARYIERNPSWKPWARGLLTPFWLFASLALDFPVFLLGLCALMLATLLWPRRTRR